MSMAPTISTPSMAAKWAAWLAAMLPVPRMTRRRSSSAMRNGVKRRLGVPEPGCARVVQFPPALLDCLGSPVARHVGRIMDRHVTALRVVRPAHGVAQHLAHSGVVIGGVGFMARTEIEDIARPAPVGQARAE